MALRPMVICGPSGSGKSTLLNRLMKEFPEKFSFVISHTTRKPRQGEKEGTHYHFVTQEEMSKAVNGGEFIEHAIFGGNLYGTSKAAINKVLAEGKVAILDIETQGVRQVKLSSDFKPHFVFIKPPSVDVLKERLWKRRTETEQTMHLRMSYALQEIEYGSTPGNFDIVIVNDVLEKAYADLKNFVLMKVIPEAVAPPDGSPTPAK